MRLVAVLVLFACLPAAASAAVAPQLDTVRLDVYAFDGKANAVDLQAYPYGKVSQLRGKVEGVKGTFAFADRSKALSPGAPYKTYSACQDADTLSTAQEKAFAALGGRTGVKLTWRYKGDHYKTTIKVDVTDASGIGPTCADLEGRA